MDVSAHKLINAEIHHARLFPKKNAFNYGSYYLDIDLNALEMAPDTLSNIVPLNRTSWHAFYQSDHGKRSKNENLLAFANALLNEHAKHVVENVRNIRLITMPRILGYLFNPVSFWLCISEENTLLAVIAEVNNTFSETHSYVLSNQDGTPIQNMDWLQTDKQFHVSPFLERSGYYAFRFDINLQKTNIWIRYFNEDGKLQLATSLIGKPKPLTKKSLRQAAVCHPLITFKVIWLIHWQALKLIMKGIRHLTKPQQIFPNHSSKTKKDKT